MTDPRVTWKLGAFIAGLGFVLSFVMVFVEGGFAEPHAQPWRIGVIGFAGVATISIAGLLVSRKR